MIGVLLLACSAVPGPIPADPASGRRATAEAVDTAPERIVTTRSSGSGRSVEAGWEPEALGSRLLAIEGGRTRVLVDASWNADRPALSDDGRWVAFVSGRFGLASVWIVAFEGGEPRQLTNVGVAREKGATGAPAGFVPPPVDGSLRFDGEALTWTGPDGETRRVTP